MGKTGDSNRAIEILSKAIELIETHNKKVLYGHEKLVAKAKKDAETDKKHVDEHNKVQYYIFFLSWISIC